MQHTGKAGLDNESHDVPDVHAHPIASHCVGVNGNAAASVGQTKQLYNGVNVDKPRLEGERPAALAFGWSDVRDAFVSWLPPGTVQLSKHFSSLEQHDDHVVVHFADGSSVAARVVVGADGCFSEVRQQTLGDGPPHYEVRPVTN